MRAAAARVSPGLGSASIFGVSVASPADIVDYIVQSFSQNQTQDPATVNQEIADATRQAMGPNADPSEVAQVTAAAQASYWQQYGISIQQQKQREQQNNIGGAPVWVWVGLFGVGLVGIGALSRA